MNKKEKRTMKTNEILNKIEAACTGGISAIRVITRLTPVANGDKVFPPTYTGDKDVEKNPPPRYHEEERLIDGKKINVVVLDSVQSQANRLEHSLLRAFDTEECEFPLLSVEIPNHSRVTALDAPHRVHDAIFRDSEYKENGQEELLPFRQSSIGRAIVKAAINNATAFFEYCPTALIFGTWDSTAGEGTRGTKIQRALTSEIVGINAVTGKRSGSRIDPLGIEDVVKVYRHETDFWTLDEKSASGEKRPEFGEGNKKGKPSAINHGNIPPSLTLTGGVTISEAVQTTVLSFVQLRRLRFPSIKQNKSDVTAKAEHHSNRDVAGRTVLATLALYAIALQMEEGYDLRSRCQLIPLEGTQFEFVGPTAADVHTFTLERATAKQLFDDAYSKAKEASLEWQAGLIELYPSAKLLALVHRSHPEN
jgi:CRISPR-associated protein Csb1